MFSMTYFYFSLNVHIHCVNIGVSVMNVTDFVTLYLHKRSFIETFKVPASMYTSFSIIIWYTENISSHDNLIKNILTV